MHARRRDGEARRQAADLLRRYRGMFRRAGYRVIGQRVVQTGVPGLHGRRGTYDGARIVEVSFREEGAPRLVLSWGNAGSSSRPVRVPVLTPGDR